VKSLVVLISAFFLISCATIFSRGSDSITFKSTPAGASVYLNGKKIGKTPMTYELDRSTFDHYYITLRKKGYKNEKFLLKKKVTTAAIFNLSALSSWATDATTGNMFQYQPNHYFIDLEKKGSASVKKGLKMDLKFALVNHQKILSEIPNRRGEYLDSYAKILSIPETKKNKFVEILNSKLSELSQHNDAEVFYSQTKQIAIAL